jgi:hypothetical protein
MNDTADGPMKRRCCPYISAQPTLSMLHLRRNPQARGRQSRREDTILPAPSAIRPSIHHIHTRAAKSASWSCTLSQVLFESCSPVLRWYVVPCAFGGVHGGRRPRRDGTTGQEPGRHPSAN